MTVKQNLKFSSLVACLCLNSVINLVKPSNGFTSEQSIAQVKGVVTEIYVFSENLTKVSVSMDFP